MKGYWIKIAFGALGVFIVGMVIMSIGRRGVDKVREAIDLQAVSLIADNAPFRVHGIEMGTVTGVKVQPNLGEGFPHIELAVRLNSGVSPSDLTDCVLVATEDERASNEGLSCVDATTADAENLVEVGMVRLEPGGEMVRLMAPRAVLEQKNWFRWFQRQRAAPVAPSPTRASLQLQADSSKAFLMIRDEKGNPVFQLNADSEGAFFQVRDSNGQEIVRFRADSSGVQGNIQSD